MKVLRKNQLQIALQLLVSIFLIRYALLKPLKIKIELSDFEFLLFIVSFIIIYAGGLLLYIILKQEKHPHRLLVKNIDKAYYIYLGLNSIGIGISFMLANEIGNVGYFGFFIALAAILYLYITQWKKIILINNIVFACLSSYLIFIGAILDLLPTVDLKNELIPPLRLLYILFSFGTLITLLFFIKTLIIDLKDVKFDIEHHKKTLATLHGTEKGAVRTSYLILIPLILIAIFVVSHFQELQLLCIYILIAIVIPLIVLFFQLFKSKTLNQFNLSNNILNIIIWLSIFSIVFLFFNLKNYAAS